MVRQHQCPDYLVFVQDLLSRVDWILLRNMGNEVQAQAVLHLISAAQALNIGRTVGTALKIRPYMATASGHD